MPRHFPSKTDYRKYVKKCHEQARIFTGEIKGTSCSTARTNFHPKIDTEKDYFNDKYQNVVRGYQNLVAMDEYRDRSQEEWRWSHYQGVRWSLSSFCDSFQKTRISSEEPNLAQISEPFGHNSLYAHMEPVEGDVGVVLYDYEVLRFSEDGHVDSFLEYIIKG
jgi:hypothetical protein